MIEVMIKHGLKVDPIEFDPDLVEIFEKVTAEAQAQLERECSANLHMLLAQDFSRDLIKQKILKKQYGIKWKTVAEMNPDTCFDWTDWGVLKHEQGAWADGQLATAPFHTEG